MQTVFVFLLKYLVIGVLVLICAFLRTPGWKDVGINTSENGIPWGSFSEPVRKQD